MLEELSNIFIIEFNPRLIRIINLIPYAIIILSFLIYRLRVNRITMVQGIKDSISRDLHDHIGSSLASISILLKVAEASVKTNPEHSSLTLKKISETMITVQENLDDIVWGVQYKDNNTADFLLRMKEFMFVLLENKSIGFEFIADPKIEKTSLPVDRCFNFYLIFKEIINNGAKYSNAEFISLHIRIINNSIEMIYRDNGKGFNVNQSYDGNGLINIQKRALALKGKLSIDSSLAKGTSIRLQFPI